MVEAVGFRSDEALIGITSKGGMIIGVGGYVDSVNYDAEGLIVVFNQSGETLNIGTIDLGGDELLIDVCLDNELNCYIAGNGSPVGFNRWRPKDFIRNPSFQAPYCIIANFDSLGNMKWGIVESPYVATGVAVDTRGDCYSTGGYGEGFYDFCVVKIRPSGDTAWTRIFDYSLMDILYRPANDRAGNLIAPGFTFDFSTMRGVVMKV